MDELISTIPDVPRIFTRNDPTILRIFPPLAKEIGLNESVTLLQIDFLISISRTKGKLPYYYDAKFWTRQSLRELRDNWLPFWSPQTIARALHKLRDEHELIFITNKYNEYDYDKSQWIALNPQGFGRLTSVTLHMVQSNGTGVFQDGTGLFQDGTTIPEIPLDLNNGSSIREQDDYQDLLNEVVRVCKRLNILALKETDYAEIDKLYAMEISVGQLARYYAGQESWWFRVYWKGKKAHFPTPKDLVETIGSAMGFEEEGMKVPMPGRRPAKRKGNVGDYLKDNPQISDKEEEDFRL